MEQNLLAHLAKCHVTFCHHFASISYISHNTIVFSETPEEIGTKLQAVQLWNFVDSRYERTFLVLQNQCHNCTIVLQPIHDTMTYILWLTDFIFHCKKRNGLVVAEYICRKKTIVKGPLQDYLHPLNFKPIRFSLQKWFEADLHN